MNCRCGANWWSDESGDFKAKIFCKMCGLEKEYRPVLEMKRLYEDVIKPGYMTSGSVGFDICAYESVTLAPDMEYLMPTGIAVAVPAGYEMTVRQRSGLSLKHKNYIVICIGTIDNDYRGELKVPIVNNKKENWEIKKGDRIAQCVVSPVVQCEIKEVDQLNETERGSGGFGHTGV